jgi:AcrR family transcriptional regulator
MRRVAAEVGAGTMTLYHYVRNKDEVLALVENEVMGEIVIPAERVPAGWREALTEIAVRTRDALVRHPWVFDIPQHGTAGGPNALMHFEQSLQAALSTGLETMRCLEIVAMVDDYVFGYALRANLMRSAAGEDPGERIEEWAELLAARLESLDDELYPNTFRVFGGPGATEILAEMISTVRAEGRFLDGLDLMLDGIEQEISGTDGSRSG